MEVQAKMETKEPAAAVGAEADRRALAEMVHGVLLAGIGAVALTREELEQFVQKLIDRGQIAEADGKKVVKDVMAKRKKATSKAGSHLDKRIEEVLSRMNIPTKDEIEALSAKITTLTKKVDELKKGA